MLSRFRKKNLQGSIIGVWKDYLEPAFHKCFFRVAHKLRINMMLIKPLNTVSSHLFWKNLLIFHWNPVYRSSFVLGLASIVIFVCWSFCQPILWGHVTAVQPCEAPLSTFSPMQFLLAILSWGGWLGRCRVQLHSGTVLVTLSLLIGYYKGAQETGSKFVQQNSPMVQFD